MVVYACLCDDFEIHWTVASPLLESVKDTPAQVERTIAKLEKQLEVQSANSKAQNSTNKILQELLKGS